MNPFDPYEQWLGIPLAEQPPDHYRLLAISRFESDLAAIEAAADARMQHVRRFQTGPRGSYTQKLLNEIAAARICLLNPLSKVEYDAGLLTSGVAASGYSDAILPMAVDPGAQASGAYSTPTSIQAPPVAALQINEDRDADEPTSLGTWLTVVGTIAVMLACLGAWFSMHPRLESGNQPLVAQSEQPATTPTIESLIPDAPHEPVLIMQESTGTVNLPASVAVLNGSVELESAEDRDFLVGWTGAEDFATWRFKVVKAPSQGIFQAVVTYEASAEMAGTKYLLILNGEERSFDVRPQAGIARDEFYFAIKRTGENRLVFRLSAPARETTFALQAIHFEHLKLTP